MTTFENYDGYSRLPFNADAEMAVLGAVLIDPDAINIVTSELTVESFYKDEHREIYSIYLMMNATGHTIDVVTVAEEMSKNGVFETAAICKSYIASLIEAVPSAKTIESYINIVKEKYVLRRLTAASHKIIKNVEEGSESADNIRQLAESEIYDIANGKDKNDVVRIDSVMKEVLDKLNLLASDRSGDATGIKTGFRDLDNLLIGLGKQDLVLLAARPSVGKTTFAMNIAVNVAKRGHAVAIFSLEMGKDQLGLRMLSTESLVDVSKLRTGKIDINDWQKIGNGVERLMKTDIYIDDSSGITVNEMKSKLRRLRNKNLGLVVVDYLQLMHSGRRIENRVQEVSEITRGLKIMAKDLGVPILTLSQLSRSIEKREDHRPRLSDLRESGSIEQDADIVLFLAREVMKGEDAPQESFAADCYVAKNRNGETGVVTLQFDGARSRFSDTEFNRDE